MKFGLDKPNVAVFAQGRMSRASTQISAGAPMASPTHNPIAQSAVQCGSLQAYDVAAHSVPKVPAAVQETNLASPCTV